MKTRISVKLDYDLYDKFVKYAPEYGKSKIMESLIIKYLKEGVPEMDRLKGNYVYLCSFTIELSVWKQFKETVSNRGLSETMASILEKMLRKFMEERQFD